MDSNAQSAEADVRALAQRHGLGAREIAALTVFVERVRTGDQASRVMPKWRDHAVQRLAESLDALELTQVRRAKDAADIGSGAGFPGLALAAALADANFTLIEQNVRRCGFLRQCVEAMALTNVEVVQAPVQLWADGESQFDLVTARGLWRAPAMFLLATPLLKDGGALVLWEHDPEKDGVEEEVRAAALRLSLSPVAIVGEGGLCLNVYTKMENPSAAASASVQPPERLSRSRPVKQSRRSQPGSRVKLRTPSKDRPKLARNVSECEALISQVSARIDELKRTRHGLERAQAARDVERASERLLERTDSRIQQLDARRVALGEQLEFQKSLLSAQPREQERNDLLTAYEHENPSAPKKKPPRATKGRNSDPRAVGRIQKRFGG